MKNRIIFKVSIFVIATICLSFSKSYAAIEIKDTTSVLTNKTISEFYDMTEEMKNVGQGLEGTGTNLDVKMANNYEWAAVSYFSNSSYGTGGEGGNTGIQLEGSTHKSTNGNITGVMDWGKTYTFTAGIIANWKNDSGTVQITDPTVLSNGASIISAAGTNIVDKFKNSVGADDYDIAKATWYSTSDNWVTSRAQNNVLYPYCFRQGLFGFYGGNKWDLRWYSFDNEYRANGAANSTLTFRPVFYAQ